VLVPTNRVKLSLGTAENHNGDGTWSKTVLQVDAMGKAEQATWVDTFGGRRGAKCNDTDYFMTTQFALTAIDVDATEDIRALFLSSNSTEETTAALGAQLGIPDCSAKNNSAACTAQDYQVCWNALADSCQRGVPLKNAVGVSKHLHFVICGHMTCDSLSRFGDTYPGGVILSVRPLTLFKEVFTHVNNVAKNVLDFLAQCLAATLVFTGVTALFRPSGPPAQIKFFRSVTCCGFDMGRDLEKSPLLAEAP
jgi:hypothetical protein